MAWANFCRNSRTSGRCPCCQRFSSSRAKSSTTGGFEGPGGDVTLVERSLMRQLLQPQLLRYAVHSSGQLFAAALARPAQLSGNRFPRESLRSSFRDLQFLGTHSFPELLDEFLIGHLQTRRGTGVPPVGERVQHILTGRVTPRQVSLLRLLFAHLAHQLVPRHGYQQFDQVFWLLQVVLSQGGANEEAAEHGLTNVDGVEIT